MPVDEDRAEAERRRRPHVVVLAPPDMHGSLGRSAAALEKTAPVPGRRLVAMTVLGGDRKVGPDPEPANRELEQIAIHVREDREVATLSDERPERGRNFGKRPP